MNKLRYLKKITYAFFSVVLVGLVFIYYNSSKQINDLNGKIKDLTLKLVREKSTTKMLRENLKLNCSNAEVYISDFKLYHDGDTTFLSEHLNCNKTIFFFSERHCQQCIEVELENIKKMTEKNYLLILTDVKRQKYLNILSKINDDQLKIYCSDFDYGQLDVSRYQTPFYFKLDTNLKLLSSFFPDKQELYLSREYLLQ